MEIRFIIHDLERYKENPYITDGWNNNNCKSTISQTFQY
jgi:hypothetical protein